LAKLAQAEAMVITNNKAKMFVYDFEAKYFFTILPVLLIV